MQPDYIQPDYHPYTPLCYALTRLLTHSLIHSLAYLFASVRVKQIESPPVIYAYIQQYAHTSGLLHSALEYHTRHLISSPIPDSLA